MESVVWTCIRSMTSDEEVPLETRAVLIDATVVVRSYGESYQPWGVFRRGREVRQIKA